MRFRYDPTDEQRTALQAHLLRFQQPAAVLDVLRGVLPADVLPGDVVSTVQKARDDRFVLRVRVRANGAGERAYALKVYSDAFGERVWGHAQALAAHQRPDDGGMCLPIRYVPQEQMLIFPWVNGVGLAHLMDDRQPELLAEAARVAAGLHRVAIVPEQPTTAAMLVAAGRARHERLRCFWPDVSGIVESLFDALEPMIGLLDPADPVPVHGDLAAGQFVWTGDRLMLLDLDMFGYADPAYDVGHFLGQLERRCLCRGGGLAAHAAEWATRFRDAYLAAMPHVSRRNIAFYHGLTLAWKIYNACRRQPGVAATLAPQFALRARAALAGITSRLGARSA